GGGVSEGAGTHRAIHGAPTGALARRTAPANPAVAAEAGLAAARGAGLRGRPARVRGAHRLSIVWRVRAAGAVVVVERARGAEARRLAAARARLADLPAAVVGDVEAAFDVDVLRRVQLAPVDPRAVPAVARAVPAVARIVAAPAERRRPTDSQ